jgi:hypothetical protein
VSLFEILTRFGLGKMLGFLLLGLAFVTLHLIRLPVRLLLVLLTAAMRRVDFAVTGHLAAPDGAVAG